MTDNQRLSDYLLAHQADMVAHLTQLVEMESPSDHKPSLDRLAAVLAEHASAAGAQSEILRQNVAGDIVRARWGSVDGGVLLLCHMDTVWDLGTLAQRPVRVEDGRLYGPGAFDMKGGIVNALWAMRALGELELMPSRRVTLLITSDEEIGSDASRALIEAEARVHEVVFVLEPAHPPRASLKTWRKGVGGYRVTVTGRAAHAGAAHDEGINAIEELARHVLTIQALTDYAAGTTVNVGVIRGGTRSNVVPEQAWAEVDFRVMNLGEAARVDAFMRGLKPQRDGSQARSDRRPESPAYGAYPGHRRAIRPRRGHRGGAGLSAHRDRYGRRFGRQLHGRAGRAHPGWTGRGGGWRPRAARARGPVFAAGADRVAGRHASDGREHRSNNAGTCSSNSKLRAAVLVRGTQVGEVSRI